MYLVVLGVDIPETSTNVRAIGTFVGCSNGSGTFQHMQPALRFNNIVSNAVSMIKISNGSCQGGLVSCAKVTIAKGSHDGGNDVLLLGDQALMLALNGLEPNGAL